ncbi:hypothetical protein B0H14DRAFT_3434422 [Mycena olivaceomarginata]|nr:hypothetical protein B0H14DRAFT_3434422 [Mycena olivaceomarginata]
MGEAAADIHLLWSLLNVNLYTVAKAPTVPPPVSPVDNSDSPQHLTEDDLAATEAVIVDLAMEDELQQALRAVQDVVGLRRGKEEEIDACAYAAAALVIDNLARIDDLPVLEDLEQLEQSRQDIARIIKMTPETVESLLMGLKTSFGGSSAFTVATAAKPSPPSSVSDVTTTELQPLVSIREQNQTEHARKGVRSYKAGCKRAAPQDGAAVDATGKKNAEPTQAQVLARRIQAARTEQPENEDASKTTTGGNAANAAAAAEVRASAAVRLAEAGIAPLTPLNTNDYVLWSKITTSCLPEGGGKAGKHDYVPSVDSIGRVSYVLVQTFAYSGGQMFQRLHSASAALGISRYAHLPTGSILLRIPDKVALKHNVAEVSSAIALKYKELQKEKNGLVSAVTTLNTVQRRGQPNANIADIEEDDDVDM